MRAQNGQKAIDFTLEDMNGIKHSLSELKGKKILLSFYRDATCPFCNLRVYELTRRYPEFQAKNMVMVAVFHSHKVTVKRYVGKGDRPFMLLADPEKVTYKLYEVHKSIPKLMKAFLKMGRMFRAFSKGYGPSMATMKPWLPVDILIDENFIVRDAFYSDDAATHIPMQRIEKFVSKGPQRSVSASEQTAVA